MPSASDFGAGFQDAPVPYKHDVIACRIAEFVTLWVYPFGDFAFQIRWAFKAGAGGSFLSLATRADESTVRNVVLGS